MKYPVEVSMPPALFKSTVSGKTFFVAGKWIEVPEGTTMEDADKFVKYVKRTYDIKEWKIHSSSGSSYTVRRIDGKRYTCNCPGFKFRGRCKHIDKVRK